MKYFKLNPPVMVGSTAVTLLGVAEYSNGRMGVELYSIMSAEDGGDGIMVEPFDTLSVNLPDQMLMGDWTFFARDYSYHAETYKAFLAAGLIEKVTGTGNVGGHGHCSVARLTAKAYENPVTGM